MVRFTLSRTLHFSHSYASGCGTIYHHDYYVQNNMHFYYDIEHIDTGDGIPGVLEIGEHQFAETKVLVGFRLQMCLAWCVSFWFDR